jgi:hypothetical protein
LWSRAEQKKQKFVLRSALRPNQISFSHSLGPFLPHARLAQCPELVEADIEEAETYHSASRARIIAGLSGFLTLSQSRDGPDR